MNRRLIGVLAALVVLALAAGGHVLQDDNDAESRARALPL
jgi:hypothetical protein